MNISSSSSVTSAKREFNDAYRLFMLHAETMDQKHQELIGVLSTGEIVTQMTKEVVDYKEEWHLHETLFHQLMQKRDELFDLIPLSEFQSFKGQLDLLESLFNKLDEKKTHFFDLLPKL
jgi:hypothetical protein